MRSYVIIICILWCEVFALIFLLAGIILGSLGLFNYVRNRDDERIYYSWKTLCIVRNYTSNRCDCQWPNDYCKIYPCFNEEFLVDYEIFNKTIVRSYIKTKDQRNQRNLDIGKNATCYYNGRNQITSVKWNYGDKTLGFILFCIGNGIIALVLSITVVICVFLMIARRRNERKLVYYATGNSCNDECNSEFIS